MVLYIKEEEMDKPYIEEGKKDMINWLDKYI